MLAFNDPRLKPIAEAIAKIASVEGSFSFVVAGEPRIKVTCEVVVAVSSSDAQARQPFGSDRQSDCGTEQHLRESLLNVQSSKIDLRVHVDFHDFPLE